MVLIDTIRVGTEYRRLREGPGWSVVTATTDAGISELGRLRTLGDSRSRLHLIAGTAWIEGSVGKSLRGSNYPAATVEETREAVDLWSAEASEWVEFDGDLRVNRLDVVRDFDLGSGIALGTVLDGLSAAPVVGRKVKARYRDAANEGAETLQVRTRTAGMGRLYDKHRETRGAVAPGILRFEAEERKRGLRAAGVESVRDLEPTILERLGAKRFEWCGFGVEFDSWDSLVARILAADDLTDGTKLRVIGWYSIARTGRGVGLERTLDYRMRKFAGRFGLPSSSRWRLDLDEGLLAA